MHWSMGRILTSAVSLLHIKKVITFCSFLFMLLSPATLHLPTRCPQASLSLSVTQLPSSTYSAASSSLITHVLTPTPTSPVSYSPIRSQFICQTLSKALLSDHCSCSACCSCWSGQPVTYFVPSAFSHLCLWLLTTTISSIKITNMPCKTVTTMLQW